MKDNCNCTDPQYESFYDDVDICHDGESWACLSDIYFNFVKGNYSDTFCKQQCPLECIKTRYYFSTSSNKINIDYYSKTIDEFALKNGIINENETLSLEDKSNSIIKFNIYYDSLSYTVTTESAAMDVVALLSNMGGTLGLFLGVSVLTAVELIEIIIQAILISIKN
jgi:hypothetical protein